MLTAVLTTTVTLFVCSCFYGFYQAGKRAGILQTTKNLVGLLNAASIGANSSSPSAVEVLQQAVANRDVN
jgi:hypothetical protein